MIKMTVSTKIFIVVAILSVLGIFSLTMWERARVPAVAEIHEARDGIALLKTFLPNSNFNWDVIKTIYKKRIKRVIGYVDVKADSKLDWKILDAVKIAKKVDLPAVVLQIVVHTSIRGLFFGLEYEVRNPNKLNGDYSGRIKAFNESLLALIDVKNNSEYSALSKRVEDLAEAISRNIKSKNKNEIKRKGQELITVYTGIFVMKILDHLAVVEDLQKKDENKAQENMAVAKLFFENIYEDLGAKDQKGAWNLDAELSRVPRDLDLPKARQMLSDHFKEIVPELTAERFRSNYHKTNYIINQGQIGG